MPIRWNRPNKYGNIHTSRGDSILETRRRAELELLEKAGKIKDLRTQVKFVLIPAQYESFPRYSPKTGKRLKDGRRLLEKECSYYADFVYVDNETGKTVVEDAKGYRTETYLIKRKLMLYNGIKIKEITKDG